MAYLSLYRLLWCCIVVYVPYGVGVAHTQLAIALDRRITVKNVITCVCESLAPLHDV